jgi:MerR family transcriptional regulator, heat shock protein HspR
MSADEPLYTMAVAARLTGMHPQTLRKYERAGLISPARPSGNQRLYSESDIERLRRIQHLVDERGVNVAGLELALSIADRLDAIETGASTDEMRLGIDEARGMGKPESRSAA